MNSTHTWQEIVNMTRAAPVDIPAGLVLGLIFLVLAAWIVKLFWNTPNPRVATGALVGVMASIMAGALMFWIAVHTYQLAEEPILESHVPVAQLPDSLRGITPIFRELDTTSPFYRIVKAPGIHAPIQITIYCSRQYLEDTMQPVILPYKEESSMVTWM